MVIYLDLVLIANFLIDYSLITYTGLITREKIKIIRVFLATLFALTGFVLFFIPIMWVFILLRFLYSLGIIYVAFSYVSLKQYIKNVVIFYLLNFVMAGIVISYDFEFTNQAIPIHMNHTTTWYLLIISFILANVVTYIYKVIEEKQERIKKSLFDVKLRVLGETYLLKGFMDTGNQVISYGDQLPVVFIDQKRLNVELSEQNFIDHQVKFTYIITNTVNEQSLLLSFRPEFFGVYVNGKCIESKVYVAVGNNIKSDEFQVILNSNLEWG